MKTVIWHSLTYTVGIASTMAVHQVSPGSPADFQSGTTVAVTTTGHIANRSAKSDRLPIKELKFRANDQAPPDLSRQNAPNPKLKSDCKPPIDVIGRCFADVRVDHPIA
jgi:hypothetical protein